MSPEGRSVGGYAPISDYGIVGDCHTAALVGRDGSIDWYCPGRFDAPAVFCKILDAAKGGFFSVRPRGDFSSDRRYMGETNVLQTTFTQGGSKAIVADFMPVYRRSFSRRGRDVGNSRHILRRVEGLSGSLEMEVLFRPTFEYARESCEIVRIGAHAFSAQWKGGGLALKSDGRGGGAGRVRDGGIDLRLTVKKGDVAWLALTDFDGGRPPADGGPSAPRCERHLRLTRSYWEEWAGRCRYRGPYRAAVLRSALTLKLLTYERTGAVVAAPTTSLPEEIGGVRNWDYRFSWLRDSSMILYALLNVGYKHEAADFFEWLQEIHHRDPGRDPRVLYGIDGREDLEERVLENLEGYMRSAPVRIGNAAAGQLQLDIYGEVLSAAHLYFRTGIGVRGGERPAVRGDERRVFRGGGRELHRDWPLLEDYVERVLGQWDRPDSGIWEVRGRREHFTYSKLMCWVAVDRGIRLAEEFGLQAPLERWRERRREIRDAILSRGYEGARGTFVQAFDASDLDAGVLAIPRVGFLSATDPRMRSTVDVLRRELTRGGLVYRYRTEDGLPGGEVTFSLCSFWMVDALVLAGRSREAHDLFERVCGYANDLGLFSEEIDPADGGFLGNFPQGFTHMALINAAVNLAKVTRHGAEHEPQNEADRAEKAQPAAGRKYDRSDVIGD